MAIRTWWILGGVAAVAIAAASFFAAGGGLRARYYTIELDVVVESEKVTLGGEVVCHRRRSGWTQGGGHTYGLPHPVTFAAKLKSGDVIGVRPKSFCLESPAKDLAAYAPAIFLFAKGDPPPRILAYVHPKALRDAKQPVHISAIRVSSRRTAGVGDLFRSAKPPQSVRDLLPWTDAPRWQKDNKPQWFYRGYLAAWSSFDAPAGKLVLQHVPPQPHSLTRVELYAGAGRKIRNGMREMPSGGLGFRPEWTDTGQRCRAGFRVLCPAVLRQRPAAFDLADGRHEIRVPDTNAHGPLVMLPVEGGPPPRYRSGLGHSGDQEISKRVPVTLAIGEHRLNGTHELISKYFNELVIDWSNKRIMRVYMVEVNPSDFN